MAPFVGALLLCGCSHEPHSQTACCAAPDGTLTACPDPQLEPLQEDAASSDPSRGTLPVAYPASELDRPLRLARPFPLVDRPLSSTPLSSDPPGHKSSPQPAELNGPELGSPAATAIELPSDPADEQAPLPAPTPAPPRHLPAVAPPPRWPTGGNTAGPQPAFTRPTERQPDAMRAVTQRAEQTIRHGYHLAERGALYSARAEFIQALRVIAQATDVRSGAREHIESLSAGLTALEEAEDFIPDGSRLESDLDVAALIKAHQTPICKGLDADELLPVVVLQHYYTYAQERLAVAAGGTEAASMALFGLGKTYATMAVDKSMPSAIAEPKAMVFHWAALSAHGGNFLAANELAVLEARWGQNATARTLLQHSVAILPHAAVWRNLALVHQRLGETKLAELAMQEAERASQREAAASPGNPQGIVPSADVQWLDSREFAATSRAELDVQKPAAPVATAPGASTTPVVTPAPPRQRSATGWFPWFR
jgi:tetratricopeptide (TPR) repeat protein